MHEVHFPAVVEVDPATSISTYLVRHGTESPSATMFRQKVGETWVDWSASKALDVVRAIAKGLRAAGYGPGDRIAIMSRTRLEWTLADFAIWHIGGVPVPIYETSSASQAQWILSDAACVGAFVETTAHAAVIEEARGEDEGHHVRDIWVFDEGALAVLEESGDGVDEDPDSGFREVGLESLATIIYTSGTTGRPKGVELSHGNFVVLLEQAIEVVPEILKEPGACTLLFLPLAHVFARVVEVLMVMSLVPMGHASDPKEAVKDIAVFKPTVLLSVPRIWEKIYNSAELKTGSGLKRRIFRWAAKVSIVHSRESAQPGGPGSSLALQHRLADKLVYSKIREVLGGNLHWTISGGAPLGERLGNFFQGIGVNMLEGYGLTETTAPCNLNLPGKARIGTVGQPLPGTSIRIAEDGEILIRGVGVFERYHGNPGATAEAIQDGWFHSGDVGYLDADGYLTITGRKKEIIVTAGGKNVAPAMMEDPLRGHPIISQAVVVGDGQPFIGALITLDAEVLPKWLDTHGRPAMTVAEAATDEYVREHVQMAIDRVNRKFSRAESIREFRILADDFTIENDLLTPSMKFKRREVLATYSDVVDSIYASVAR
ncbi:MAG: AMP-dependent synthetase/ligase [Actinomycetes bacterium]|nr:AMP-dependent synthetase/ligase [Actinomycetes bacterium]